MDGDEEEEACGGEAREAREAQDNDGAVLARVGQTDQFAVLARLRVVRVLTRTKAGSAVVVSPDF